jgi:hypothetical protein
MVRFSRGGIQLDGFPGSLGCRSKITFSQQRSASLVVTLRGIRLLSRRRDRDKRRNHDRTQGEQYDGTMLEEAIHGQPTPVLSSRMLKKSLSGTVKDKT